MSKPRKRWWTYVKNMIKAYPQLKEEYEELHTPSLTINLSGMPGGKGAVSNPVEQVALTELKGEAQKEYEAVTRAIEITKRSKTAKERLMIIDLVLWKQSHNISGAALKAHVSDRTAHRFYTMFIYLVAKEYGFDIDSDQLRKV